MQYHILNAITEYKNANALRMHMAGHKADAKFLEFFSDGGMDITELSFADVLDNPSGIILQAEKDIANIIQSRKSFLLTDGSTSGIYAMLYPFKNQAKSIIINRNSHKSVYNACALFSIEPITLQGDMSYGVILPPSAKQVEKCIEQNKNICAICLTSPDYYGNVIDGVGIKRIAQKFSLPLLIDGAHGSHLAYFDRDIYAGSYADVWVDGVHKTLMSLTQGALLNVSNTSFIGKLCEAVSVFRTTSPSYPIMASIEFGVKQASQIHLNYFKKLTEAIDNFKIQLKELGLTVYPSKDKFKCCVDFSMLNISTQEVEKRLENQGVYVELNDGRYIIFYLSVATKVEQIEKLFVAIKNAVEGSTKVLPNANNDKIEMPKQVMPYLKASSSDFVQVELLNSIGKVCAKNVGLFPPCFPMVLAGEIISQAIVEKLKDKNNTFGLNDGKISVVKS